MLIFLTIVKTQRSKQFSNNKIILNLTNKALNPLISGIRAQTLI